MIISQNNCICNHTDTGNLRPYEKCLEFGSEILSDSELLAVILRTGTNGTTSVQLAENIFNACHKEEGIRGLLGITIPELMKIKGVGKVKAIQIRCICELSRRIAKQSARRRMDFSNPKTIADYYMNDLRHLSKEHMIVVMLDSKCRLITDVVISVGTVNSSLVTPREVYKEALKYEAVSVVVLHNHPSGDATPSRNDIMVTKRLKEAGEVIGINLLDHIIIGDNTYTSLKEKDFM